MFGLFKKTSPIDKLVKEQARLLNEARLMSTKDRKASDALYEKAQQLDQKIAELMQ